MEAKGSSMCLRSSKVEDRRDVKKRWKQQDEVGLMVPYNSGPYPKRK